jgi:PAS domain S-box-containing protein
MATALADGQPQRGREVVIERPDGSRLIALVNIEPLLDQYGRVQGAINCFDDITERKRTENLLQVERNHTRSILDALPAAIYTTDAEGRITYFNPAAADLAGRKPTIGHDKWCVTFRLYRPDGTPLPHDECPMAIAIKERRAIRGQEAIAERPDGTRVPFVPYPTPMFGASGDLIGAINMLVDIGVG